MDQHAKSPGQIAEGGDVFSMESITERARMDALAASWNALADRDPNATIFQSHPWISVWLRHHPESRPFILAAFRGGRLTAALPLGIHATAWGPLRLRTLRLLADEDSDYGDGLADPDFPEDLSALWTGLMQRRDWELMDLRYVREGGRLFTLAQDPRSPMLRHCEAMDIAPYLEIGDGWQKSLAASEWSAIQRRRRRITSKGTLSLEIAKDPAAVDAMLEQLAAMHSLRWQSREISKFRLAQHRAWVHDVCHALLQDGHLQLYRLALNGDPISIGIYYYWQRRLLCYTATIAQQHMKFGPGHLLLLAVTEDARARGVADVHDFGRGAEEYKLHWTQQRQQLYRIRLARRRTAGVSALWWQKSVQPLLSPGTPTGTAIARLRSRLAVRSRLKMWKSKHPSE